MTACRRWPRFTRVRNDKEILAHRQFGELAGRMMGPPAPYGKAEITPVMVEALRKRIEDAGHSGREVAGQRESNHSVAKFIPLARAVRALILRRARGLTHAERCTTTTAPSCLG